MVLRRTLLAAMRHIVVIKIVRVPTDSAPVVRLDCGLVRLVGTETTQVRTISVVVDFAELSSTVYG